MRTRTNYAPTARTIIVALVLMVVGLLGTYGSILPNEVGVLAFVLAVAILLVGMVVKEI
jgi:hypothetical protein